MMEQLRSIDLTIVVDTNKTTHSRRVSFESMDEAQEWLAEFAAEVLP